MTAPDLIKKLQADLKAALGERDRPAVKAIRLLMTAISNAEAVEVEDHAGGKVINPGDPVIAGRAEAERRHLTGADVAEIVAAELRDHDEHITTYEQHDQHERAAELRAERDVLARYL